MTTSGRRLLVVSNADAGTNDRDAVDAAVRTWQDAGCEVELVATTTVDELADVVAEVDDDQVLVAAGGDGSLRAVVIALSAADRCDEVVVGLLPLGTGNDVARGVGIPLDPEEAARSLLSSQPRELDLLIDQDGTVGVNLVHVGIGASASELASGLKERLGAAAYPVGAVAAGASEPGWHLRVTVDGQVLVDADDVLHVVIGNGPSMGGGAIAAPGASHQDRTARVVVSQATGPVARVGYAAALQRGDHLDRDDVRATRGTVVVVEGDEHPWNVDGELPPPRTRSQWTLRPAAWTLLVPDDPVG